MADDDSHDMDKDGKDPAREQDCYLPIANITRLMKEALPPEAKVGREAKHCMQESVSEFISFITSEASDKCSSEKRKTINGDDILWAMQSLGFDEYLEPLKLFLQRYRNSERASNRRILSSGSSPAPVSSGPHEHALSFSGVLEGSAGPLSGPVTPSAVPPVALPPDS